MKEIVEYFSRQGVLFKSFKEINKTSLNTRKKLFIYCSTDTKKNYHSIFRIDQKSRFVVKNAIELVELEHKLQVLENHNFKYKHLLRSEPTCSKATNYLKERGWKLHYDFV